MQGTYDVRQRKKKLRRQGLASRSRFRPDDLHADAVALRDVLLYVPEVNRAAVVALYVSVGTEPGTGPLLDALTRRGARVLLPVLAAEYELDWAEYAGADQLRSGPRGLLEPTGPELGLDAVGIADAVLLPGLAVDREGTRLGRGAGCYDRALARIANEAFSCVLLHDGEVTDEPLPRETHDRLVAAAATPSGLLRFREPARK